MQNPKFLLFLAPNLNYANTNLIYAIIIVYEKFESSSKMSTQVSSSVLFVTDFFSPSTTITTLELIGIAIQLIFRVDNHYIPTLTDNQESIIIKCIFLTRILRVYLTKVRSWIKVNCISAQITFFFICSGPQLFWKIYMNFYTYTYSMTGTL